MNPTGEGPRDLQVMGRKLTLQKTCGKLLDVTFNDLCMKVGSVTRIIAIEPHH